MNDQERSKKYAKPTILRLLALPIVFIMLSAFLCAGYFIVKNIPGTSVIQSLFIRYYLSAAIGTVLFAGFAFLMSVVQTRAHNKRHGRIKDEMTQITDALASIARGDFSVMLPDMDERHPLSEITDSINKMAEALGSIEQMRQDFVSNVSHEIQSPLTSIVGFVNLLKEGNLSEEKRRHYLDIIATESNRLSSLSENLLKLSSLEMEGHEMTKQAYRLDKQIEKVILILEPQWNAKSLHVDAKLSGATYYGDESLVSQLWVNLIGNAIKFTPEGGSVHISLSKQGSSVIVKVSDTGIGISPEDRLRIFERFYKVDKARNRSMGGNGLGLAIVKRIVDLHGGQISVNSEPGKGTEFTVVLLGLL